MKKFITLSLLFFLFFTITALTFSSCEKFTSYEKEVNASETGLLIVTSLFPQYDFARQIAKDKISISLLLPPGTETHIYEPSPRDMKTVTDADAFIYTGDAMEPWASKILGGTESSNLKVLNLSENLGFSNLEFHHDDDEDEHEDSDEAHSHDGENDPHIWLSPSNALNMIDETLKFICELDPANQEFYEENAQNYINRLNDIYSSYSSVIENSQRKTIVFGGRFAFSHFVSYYNFNYVSVFKSCSDEAEPSISEVSRVINYIKENNIPVIFYEELADPKIARSISEETEAEMMMFSTAHNVTKEEFNNGISFEDILKENLRCLEIALN